MLDKSEFAKQIRQALAHFYDSAYLQNLALTCALSGSDRPLDRSVRQLRTELLDAIEQLKPADNVPPRAKERRPYVLLYGRYVQAMSTTELGQELAISVRQLRREHKRALNAITNLLWDKFSSQLAAEGTDRSRGSIPPSPEHQDAAKVEVEQLIAQARPEPLTLSALVQGILTTLAPVAARHGTALCNRLPNDLPPVYADRVVLRQGLLMLTSHALDHAVAGQVVIGGMTRGEVRLRIKATGKARSDTRTGAGLGISRRLIASLDGRVELSDAPGGWQATIHLPLAEDVPILVIDDNAGLVELFRRYLAGRRYRVVEAQTAAQAIQRACEVSLRLIVLDIMMPQQDGWEILQYLQRTPETRDIPVLICSVLYEPEIAAALGASDYLTKPVTQDDLLTKVEQWCSAPPVQAA